MRLIGHFFEKKNETKKIENISEFQVFSSSLFKNFVSQTMWLFSKIFWSGRRLFKPLYVKEVLGLEKGIFAGLKLLFQQNETLLGRKKGLIFFEKWCLCLLMSLVNTLVFNRKSYSRVSRVPSVFLTLYDNRKVLIVGLWMFQTLCFFAQWAGFPLGPFLSCFWFT